MEILNQFGINPLLLAAQIVNFLVLLFILKKFLYGPILKVLETRKQKIEESLKNAEEIQRKLEQTEVETKKILAKAALDGQAIIKEATDQAAQITEEAKIQAGSLTQKILDDAKSQIQIEKEGMRRELQQEFSKMVMLVVEKVTGKILNQKNQKQLIEKAVKEFES